MAWTFRETSVQGVHVRVQPTRAEFAYERPSLVLTGGAARVQVSASIALHMQELPDLCVSAKIGNVPVRYDAHTY